MLYLHFIIKNVCMNNESLKGIYCILNLTNVKIYIGSTTKSFKERFDHHKSCLNNDTHKNKHLQNAWNKYGKDEFKFVILECLTDSILKKEQLWINKYHQSLLYNINLCVTNYKFTKKDIEKRRLTMKKQSKERSKRYLMWKNSEITDDDLTQAEKNQFNVWTNSWNKGIKYKNTDHLKVPKKVKGDRTKFKENHRKLQPCVEVYDKNMNYLKTFRSAKDLEEWSYTDKNDLPVRSRFNTPIRMSTPSNVILSAGINKSVKTGKPYKNLNFKFINSDPLESNF